MLFTVPALISHISTIFTLQPGDLILTGAYDREAEFGIALKHPVSEFACAEPRVPGSAFPQAHPREWARCVRATSFARASRAWRSLRWAHCTACVLDVTEPAAVVTAGVCDNTPRAEFALMFQTDRVHRCGAAACNVLNRNLCLPPQAPVTELACLCDRDSR